HRLHAGAGDPLADLHSHFSNGFAGKPERAAEHQLFAALEDVDRGDGRRHHRGELLAEVAEAGGQRPGSGRAGSEPERSLNALGTVDDLHRNARRLHAAHSNGYASPCEAVAVDRDAEQLRRMGYAQQLLREMGGFANFALSFSIISVLTGAVTLYGHGLRYGGPLQMSLGWPLVTILTLPIAMSLAELASAYPTAGALYHWSSILGGRGAGFFTAWLNTIGQFAITAGIDYGLAEFVAAMLGVTERRGTIAIFAAILASHAALNHLGVRLVARLNDLSLWVHILGVAVIVGALALFAPHQPPAFLLTKHGGPFAIGLLQACWTFTGYDASAHVSEETHDPSRNAPWGMVMAVAVSGIAGYALLLAVTLSIGDLPAAAAAENPFIFALQRALPQTGNALVLIAMAAMWFCGLSSVTSNSRQLFAFARDGGLPFSEHLAQVSPRY